MGYCEKQGCKNQKVARGMCGKHHREWRNSGDTTTAPDRRRKHEEGQTCAVSGCEGTAKYKGWCPHHYDRWRNHGDPHGGRGGPPMRKYAVGQTCDIDGCNRTPLGLGYCRLHYNSLRKYGDPLKAKWRINEQGKREWHTADNGYVIRYDPGNPNAIKNGYVYQHRGDGRPSWATTKRW